MANKPLEELKARTQAWIDSYETHEEHDMELCIALKDDAYELLGMCINVLETMSSIEDEFGLEI